MDQVEDLVGLGRKFGWVGNYSRLSIGLVKLEIWLGWRYGWIGDLVWLQIGLGQVRLEIGLHWRFVWVGNLVGLGELEIQLGQTGMQFILYLGGLLVGLEIWFGEDGELVGTEVLVVYETWLDWLG